MSSTTAAPSSSSDGGSRSSFQVALGVGIVLGVFGVGAVACVVMFIMRRNRQRRGVGVSESEGGAPRHLTRLERIALPDTGADPDSIRQLRQRRWTARHGNNGLTPDELDLVAPVRQFQSRQKSTQGDAVHEKDVGDAVSGTTATSLSASDDTCAVCLDDMVEGDKTRVLRCQHEFHDDCISAWVSKANRCPVCNVEPLEAASIAKRRNARSSARHGIDAAIRRERRRRTRSPGGFYHLDSGGDGGDVDAPSNTGGRSGVAPPSLQPDGVSSASMARTTAPGALLAHAQPEQGDGLARDSRTAPHPDPASAVAPTVGAHVGALGSK